VYIHSSPGDDKGEVDSDDRELPKINKRSMIPYKKDQNGIPILPDPNADGGMKLVNMKKLIRAFLTAHYCMTWFFLLSYNH
jgi:hypothetical protein